MSSIDINQIAAEALDLFGREDDGEKAWSYARRKFHSMVAEHRSAGKTMSQQEVQQLSGHLDDLIQTLSVSGAHQKPADSVQAKEQDSSELKVDLDTLKVMVSTVFQAPTDGSRKRARLLSKRAQKLAESEISRYNIGFFERRKLKRAIRDFISLQEESVTDY